MKKIVKWSLIATVAWIFISAITGNLKSNPNTTTEKKTEAPISTTTPTIVKAENFNMEVTSVIVKKVDKKYRYFFDIRNKDTKSFTGEVRLSLYRSNPNTKLGGETFTTEKPIEPNLGSSVFTDANTGPVSQMGENGMTNFKYEVLINKQIVKTGEGVITDKFENLD
jgi:hypothetical protein